MRWNPGLTSPVRGQLREGDQVQVLQVIDDTWAEVELPDGRHGYVGVSKLQPIAP